MSPIEIFASDWPWHGAASVDKLNFCPVQYKQYQVDVNRWQHIQAKSFDKKSNRIFGLRTTSIWLGLQ